MLCGAARRRYPPCTRTPFCLAKRGEKRSARHPAPSGFPAVLATRGPTQTRCVRCAHSTQTVSRGQLLMLASQAPGSLCASPGCRWRKQPNTEQPTAEQPCPSTNAPFPGCWLLAVGLLPRPEALSSTARPGAGASPPPQLTPPNCLNGTSEASGVSFGRAWACEQRKEPRRGAEAGGAVLVPFAKTKGTPGAGRKAPAGCTAKHHLNPTR